MVSHILRQRAEYEDMRNAYESDRSYLFSSNASSDESYRQRTSDSERSYQTAATAYSDHSHVKRPSIRQYETCRGRIEGPPVHYFPEKQPFASPAASSTSVDTYASTVPSEEALIEDLDHFHLPEYTAQHYDTAIPATPSDFSELFPSHRRLAIRHDDSTLDGNLNLRIDTEVHASGRRCDMTLFHLRMHDLKERQFSLRRYCRDSGREVCHSLLKTAKPKAVPEKRPGFQRSLSNALNNFLPKSPETKTPTMSSLKRNDSGYGSMHVGDFDDDDEDEDLTPTPDESKPQHHMTHTMKLEFSNYAQLDVTRAGAKASKRYEFNYWGVSYSWKRIVQRKHDGSAPKVSFHLVRASSEEVLAYILPVSLSPSEAREEEAKGGWIAPCTMWIADERIVRSGKDVADVVVSAGLMALVDNTIRDRFQSKQEKPSILPKVEYVGPKRLINEMFRPNHRSAQSYKTADSRSSSRPSTSHGYPGHANAGTGAGSRLSSYGSR
jgi:hypothetical protein